MEKDNKRSDATPIGEGDYDAARCYQDAQHEFAKHGPVKQKAREAADSLNEGKGDDAKRPAMPPSAKSAKR